VSQSALSLYADVLNKGREIEHRQSVLKKMKLKVIFILTLGKGCQKKPHNCYFSPHIINHEKYGQNMKHDLSA